MRSPIVKFVDVLWGKGRRKKGGGKRLAFRSVMLFSTEG